MPAGRKTKYTPETVKAIIDAVSVGTPYKYAGAVAGISHETFNQWMNKKPEFAEAIKEAEAKALTARLARIVVASSEHWQAAAAIRLLALTGCRRSEILNPNWSEVDLVGSCLRLGDTKTGASIRPLP